MVDECLWDKDIALLVVEDLSRTVSLLTDGFRELDGAQTGVLSQVGEFLSYLLGSGHLEHEPPGPESLLQ